YGPGARELPLELLRFLEGPDALAEELNLGFERLDLLRERRVHGILPLPAANLSPRFHHRPQRATKREREYREEDGHAAEEHRQDGGETVEDVFVHRLRPYVRGTPGGRDHYAGAAVAVSPAGRVPLPSAAPRFDSEVPRPAAEP